MGGLAALGHDKRTFGAGGLLGLSRDGRSGSSCGSGHNRGGLRHRGDRLGVENLGDGTAAVPGIADSLVDGKAAADGRDGRGSVRSGSVIRLLDGSIVSKSVPLTIRGRIIHRHQRGIKGGLRRERNGKLRFLRQIQRGLGTDILLAVIGRMAADGAADQAVQFVPGSFFGRGFGGIVQLQFELVCRRLCGGLFLSRGSVIVRGIGKMGQRVHAEGAAGANVDRLQRVVLDGSLGGRSGRFGAEVYIKGGTGLRFGSGGTIAGRGIPCGGCIGGVSRCRSVAGNDRRTGGRLRNRGCGLHGLYRLAHRRGLRYRLLYGLHGLGRLYRDAPGIGDYVISGMMRAIVLHGGRQVFNRFFFLLLGKQLGVVGGFFLGTVLASLLQFLVLPLGKQHYIGGGDGKEEHQPKQEHQQHNNVGGWATEQRQQCAADRRAPDTALPKAGLPTGVEHFDNLPGIGIV